MICLKGIKSDAFLISLRNMSIYGTLLVSTSPIEKPFPQFTPFFIATGLPNTIQNNIAQINEVLQPPI